MKSNIILFFLMLGCPMALMAQNQGDPYFPMLQEGKMWVTVLESGTEISYYINGDTLIKGNNWKKVYTDFMAYPDTMEHHDLYYFAAIRQEGEKIFGLIEGKEEPYLFYNFGLNVGDRFEWRGRYDDRFGFVYYITETDEENNDSDTIEHIRNIHQRPEALAFTPQEVTVEDIDTILVHGREFRRFTLKSYYQFKAHSETSSSNSPYFVWIEGIGCEGGLFVSGRKITPETQLYCMMGDTIIFEYNDFHVPGISDGISHVMLSKQINGSIYDITGRCMTIPPTRGIYIKNGRKYVVR